MSDQIFRRAVAVTPHDTNASIVGSPTALYVGGAGNIAMRLKGDGADATWVGVPAGTVLHVKPSHIRSTNTTATSILALY